MTKQTHKWSEVGNDLKNTFDQLLSDQNDTAEPERVRNSASEQSETQSLNHSQSQRCSQTNRCQIDVLTSVMDDRLTYLILAIRFKQNWQTHSVSLETSSLTDHCTSPRCANAVVSSLTHYPLWSLLCKCLLSACSTVARTDLSTGLWCLSLYLLNVCAIERIDYLQACSVGPCGNSRVTALWNHKLLQFVVWLAKYLRYIPTHSHHLMLPLQVSAFCPLPLSANFKSNESHMCIVRSFCSAFRSQTGRWKLESSRSRVLNTTSSCTNSHPRKWHLKSSKMQVSKNYHHEQ